MHGESIVMRNETIVVIVQPVPKAIAASSASTSVSSVSTRAVSLPIVCLRVAIVSVNWVSVALQLVARVAVDGDRASSVICLHLDRVGWVWVDCEVGHAITGAFAPPAAGPARFDPQPARGLRCGREHDPARLASRWGVGDREVVDRAVWLCGDR